MFLKLYLYIFKAGARYFWLFLKEWCLSRLFRTKRFEKKFNFIHLFHEHSFIPLFREHSFSTELQRAVHLLKTFYFEKVTVCVIGVCHIMCLMRLRSLRVLRTFLPCMSSCVTCLRALFASLKRLICALFSCASRALFVLL